MKADIFRGDEEGKKKQQSSKFNAKKEVFINFRCGVLAQKGGIKEK